MDRIIKMHISPINISVHTTNPELRVKMMGNRFAGQALDLLKRFADAGIKMNCQLVLCPGVNDGPELERTLSDLKALIPAVQSVAVVPVGVTKYREGLYPMKTYDAASAAEVIAIMDRFGDAFMKEVGDRVAYPADEFYLIAGKELPAPEFYGDFAQLGKRGGPAREPEAGIFGRFGGFYASGGQTAGHDSHRRGGVPVPGFLT